MLAGALIWAATVRLGWLWAEKDPAPLRSKATRFRLPVAQESGRMLSLDDLSGKGVLLNFWATWCPPCIEELPLLERLYARYDGLYFTVVGVTDEKPSEVRQWLQEHPIRYPVLLDPGGRLRARFGAEVLPYTVYVGPDGRIAGRRAGLLDGRKAAEEVERLIIGARRHQGRASNPPGSE